MSRYRNIFIALAAVVVLGFAAALWSTPTPDRIRRLALGSDRVLLAADGQLVQTLRTDFRKRRLAWSPLSSFPESLRDAVIRTEDRRFRWHLGVDPVGLGRATWALVRGRPLQGASTITMQLSDLIQDDVLVGDRPIRKGSLFHKILQTSRAILLELRWSKDEILEAYLNLIHLRGEFEGVPALSHAYLNKHPLALDEPESMIVAAMIASPNRGAAALSAKACGIQRREMGQAIDCAPFEAAAASFFTRPPRMPSSPGSAPHLARRLFRLHPDQAVLISTLDASLQQDVESILEKNLHRLKGANVRDSAAIVIENATGKVLAYVGAVASSRSPHVDGVSSPRQAGSTLKPFLYAKAFEARTLTPASILLDDATAISWDGGVYRPSNYNHLFFGPVSAREALGSSLNVPAVKVVTIIGLHQAYQVMHDIHLSGLREPDFYGVSMALGAVDVRLEELANAYRMLANRGSWSTMSYVADDVSSSPQSVFSPEASFLVASVLSDPDARSIGFGWDTPLETPFWTAVKTGTSKDYRDNWCVGFSSKYTVAVWAGNFDSEAMQNVSGVSGAGPSWADIMNRLHRAERSEIPTRPEGVVLKRVRQAWASRPHDEYFLAGTEPTGDVIELAPDRRVQFVFPAEGSTLVKDPQLDQSRIALFVRFKGSVTEGSRLFMNGQDLGAAVSPFRLENPAVGVHEMTIKAADGQVLASVHFSIKGAPASR